LTVSSKVGNDEVISKINQSAETIKISASKVNIEGAVTFSSFDTDLQSRITTAEGNASTAKSQASTANTTANTAKDILDSWKGEAEAGVTTINGGLI